MEKQVKTKVWEQQPKESDPAYAAFSIYRDMGKNRTIAAVVRECGKNRSLIDRWHKGHNWAARCRAYDNSIDEEARKKGRRRSGQHPQNAPANSCPAPTKGTERTEPVGPGGYDAPRHQGNAEAGP